MNQREHFSWQSAVRELISAQQIAERISILGAQITQDYQGKDLVAVCVLKGSFLFMSDLARQIQLPIAIDFLACASYGDETRSSGIVKITFDLSHSIEGKDVLLVEDIVDTGLTMDYLLTNLQTRHPRSLKVCALLHKPPRMQRPITIDYLGFTIPDVFVVGYGLDYAQRYRNLPFIGVLQSPIDKG